jgi:hypothetical protein
VNRGGALEKVVKGRVRFNPNQISNSKSFHTSKKHTQINTNHHGKI